MVLNLNEDGLALNYSALADGWLLPNGTAWGESVLLCLPIPSHPPHLLPFLPPSF